MVSRAAVLVAVVVSGLLLGACHRTPSPTAADLTVCGTVNSLVAGVYLTDTQADQEASAETLINQASVAGNAQLLTAAVQLRADTIARNHAGIVTSLASLGKACTSMGIGPSSGGF